MVIQRKSIFDLERRSSLVEDFNNLCDDFKRKKISVEMIIPVKKKKNPKRLYDKGFN